MPPEARKLLADMADAANSIGEFAEGKTVTDFARNKLLRAAIYYEFVIIGEALSRLKALDENLVGQISEHWRIIGFRNQIIHGYAKIDDEITWQIIQGKLPTLRSELAQLLGN